jgi:DNA-binding response OmpR family regulator
MYSRTTASAGPDVTSAFAGARFASVGFEGAESLSIAAFLAALGSLTQRISPNFTALTSDMDSYSAILLNITPSLAESSWISVPQLLALRVPVLAIGTFADLSSFPAIQVNASELLFRPFSYEELLVRIGRSLARTAQARRNVRGRRLRIVIADDDPSIIGLTSGILRAKGFECHEAKNGREALDLARTLLPDLLILDINMPFVHGFDILTALREDPGTSAMRILLFTATESPDAVRLGSELGANSFLRKPFRPFDFLRRVKALLPGSECAVQTAAAPGIAGG